MVVSLSIETIVDPITMARLLKRVGFKWQLLGESEPHWSVLTNPKFASDRIKDSLDEFYSSGAGDRDMFKAAAHRSGLELPQQGTCLELGCGVGRITLWLAETFRRVIGVDISASHLALAENSLRSRGRDNVELRLLSAPADLSQLPSVDGFFSVIVLQHNPPPVMRWLLRECLLKLKSGGLAFFQLPTHGEGYTFDSRTYISHQSDGEGAAIEMHVLPQEIVIDVVKETGCELMEVREHDCIGDPLWQSMAFLARRPI